MRKKWIAVALSISMLSCILMTGCTQQTDNLEEDVRESVVENTDKESEEQEESTKATGEIIVESPMEAANRGELNVIDDNYRTYYEVFVYSFYDSDGNGVGDIQGLTQKLDYINDGDDTTRDDLGFNGIWLMPIMPSTTYHKYDVTDYCDIDPEYGTLDDFKVLVEECHNRDVNVIIDFVMNHTSSKHEWFVAACEYLKELGEKEPSENECPYFGYYNFTKEKQADYYYNVPGTDWYYEGKFWSEMPDLNLENPALRQEFENIVDFWLEIGVDGFRLDAAKEFYSDNTTANVEVLSWFNDMVKSKKEDAYIVAEVWTEVDVYAKYYESGIDSVFDFGFANNDGMIANVVKGMSGYNATSYGKAVASLEERFGKYNENYIDAPFYTNHDMGRSAGYYGGEYAEAQIKMSAALNLFMNGSAFVYYGEELGMKGAGRDENKRAPMFWETDGEAEGMCDGPKDMEEVEMIYPSFEEQKEDTYSIYNFYKQAVLLRNRYPEIARGDVTYLEEVSDSKVCVLLKEYEGSKILLAFNVSKEKMVIDLSNLSIEGVEPAGLNVEGMLVTGEEAVEKGKTSLVLPGYSVAILK
ncbi:MAG: alpha-amylase [Lachnospiraceae bacterium]|nr:alpha-amylase [Lachnospiraceae bacterium]